MPRAALSQDQVDDFREALCEEATRLFAAHGYEGVTMRALARALGCSAMTPYRYFENKAEIFDTVRSAAAQRFGESIEAAARSHRDHRTRLRALTRAYVDFALLEPHAYRIMFELHQPARPGPEVAQDLRGWRSMKQAVTEAIEAGAIAGDPDVVAHLFWSGVHGIVALHLSGMLGLGMDLDALVEAFVARELDRPAPRPSLHDRVRNPKGVRA